MKEIPILYSTPMVQAKLAGRKTQTRRIVTERNSSCGSLLRGDGQGWHSFNWNDAFPDSGFTNENYKYLKVSVPEDGTRHRIFCRYEPGDVLWVRETFARVVCVNSTTYESHSEYRYKADHKGMFIKGHDKYKPSIFMPKEAARIWEEVVSIRVERIQDISDEDAIAEGIWLDKSVLPNAYTLYGMPHWHTAIECYRELWDGINGGGSWESNPWVWVVTSKILSTTGKPELIDYDNTARK